jgi:uncharacterized protein (TIGR03546 family)
MEDPRAKELRWWERALLARVSPHQLALGLSLGWLFGYIPKDNLLAVSLCLSLIFTRLNVIVFVLSAMIGWWGLVGLDPLVQSLGMALMEQPSLRSILLWMDQQPILAWVGVNQPLIVGAAALAVPICPLIYVTCERTLSCIRYLYRKQRNEQLLAGLVGYRRQLVNLIYHKEPVAVPATISSHFVIGESLEETLFAQDPAVPGTQDEPERQVDTSRDQRTDQPIAATGHTSTTKSNPTERSEWGRHGESVADHLRIDQQHSLEQEVQPIETDAFVEADASPSRTVRKPLSEWRSEYLEAALDELRVDASHGIPLQGPTRAVPSRSIEHETASISATRSMQLGDILQETSIDIVRIKPHGTPQQSLSTQEPDQKTSTTSLKGVQDTLIAHSTTDNSSHPQVPIAFEKREQEAVHGLPASRDDASVSQNHSINESSNAVAALPAEESLRHLLWHLTESKRGAKS